MNPIERLARRICWLGFGGVRRRHGNTEASYWESIHPDARQGYIQEAELLVTNMRAIYRSQASISIFADAERERDQRVRAAKQKKARKK